MHLMIKRIILGVLTILLCVSGSMVTYAQTSSEALQQQLHEKNSLVEEKKSEQKTVQSEVDQLEAELDSLYTEVEKNKADMAQTQGKIDEVNKLIQQKREEIVMLEDKILERKDIMKKRAVALQRNNNVDVFINLFFESDSISEFFQRASAASTLMGADKDILNAQQEDLQKIEESKNVIDEQEKVLKEEQKVLAEQQAKLDENMQQRQQSLTAMQQKLDQIAEQVEIAQAEKGKIQSQMQQLQASLAPKAASVSKGATYSAPDAAIKGKEMYVTSTAYTPYDSGSITASGYNIQANPNMKLIAVDPRVIPLGSKVWVEGYGVAIAGDTGGAIKGHKIDVLLPTKAQALQWGRRTVKIIVLD